MLLSTYSAGASNIPLLVVVPIIVRPFVGHGSVTQRTPLSEYKLNSVFAITAWVWLLMNTTFNDSVVDVFVLLFPFVLALEFVFVATVFVLAIVGQAAKSQFDPLRPT